MSLKYDEYIREHKENVEKAFYWLVENVPGLFDDNLKTECFNLIHQHDASKYDTNEYQAYDAYFYGNASYEATQDFNRAWLMHIHKNPHHWQHWVLINDDPEKGEIVLNMPDCYIVEMICDWMSFAFKKGNLYEIFDWYNEHEEYMKLSSYTRGKIESILNAIKLNLKESDVNAKE